jgi:dihydropteroate synthase
VSLGVPISVDTYKAEVIRAVLDAGVDIINDIWALRQPGAAAAVAANPGCGVCLMHMHRDPQTMQASPMTGDVLPSVLSFLERHALDLQALGVEKTRIVLDPGVGFGKTVEQNFSLLARQPALRAAGYPLLAGWSRKSSLGAVTGLDVHDRMVPSVAAAVLAAERGASILRVHDVRETVAALAVWNAMRQAGSGG